MSFFRDIDEERAPTLLRTSTTGIKREVERAERYLSNAIALWMMLEPEKAIRLKNLVDVEMKPNSARFSPRLSVGSLFKSPENEPPVIAPVNSYCAS